MLTRHVLADSSPTCVGDQQKFKMPAEEGTEDVLDGDKYPDGKIELFPLFKSHMKKNFSLLSQPNLTST